MTLLPGFRMTTPPLRKTTLGQFMTLLPLTGEFRHRLPHTPVITSVFCIVRHTSVAFRCLACVDAALTLPRSYVNTGDDEF